MKRSLWQLFAVVSITLFCSGVAWAEKSPNIASLLSQEAEISEKEAKDRVKLVFTLIESELKAGRDVTIRNFGRFSLKERKARVGRNPRTGEEIQIPARKYPRFSSSDKLKKSVNN